MTESLNNYTNIMNTSYTGKYNTYVQEVRGQRYWAYNYNNFGDQNRWLKCF
jgi:hypothetical protein